MNTAVKEVQVIKATITGEKTEKIRVAAYCRVSTDKDDQLNSFFAQMRYYRDYVRGNDKMVLVDIYADEGITGVMAKKRTNFMRMMRDCEKGKIDLILTKSVARFARNTVDSLNYVRRLKAKGIGVYFEEQALDSLKTENEMALGLYSVLAQAESENISANVRWGIRQRMQSGTFKFRYNLLGYRKGDDGNPEIVEEEAQYVRAIFNMYLDGKSLDQIKSYLEGEGVLTKTGKNVWNKCIIQAILTNERYCGDLLMQKTFTENCITKKVKKNRGEMPKYLIRDNHPAIITHATFKMAQMEMARRGSVRKKTDSGITEQGKYSGKFALTDILVCGECGSPYRRKTYSRNGENKRVWRCLSRLEHGTEFCSDSITVDDETLKKTIVRGISKAISDKQDVLNLILSNLAYAVTGEDDTLEMYAIEKQLKTLSGIMDETMELAASSTGDGKRFQEEMKSLSSQMVVLREQLEIIKGRIDSNKKVNEEIENIKQCLSADSLDFSEYNDVTIRRLVEYIRVMKDNSIIIVLKGGMKIYMNKYKKELLHLWGKVGLIVNLSQMIEYTLANVLAFDEILREFEDRDSMYVYEYNEFAKRAEKLYKELEKRPLGFGIEKARQLGYFNDKSQEWLKAMCEERNFVVHRLFREDLVSKHLETDPTFYYERLENLIEEMNAVNNNLNEIFAKQKAEYKLIW